MPRPPSVQLGTAVLVLSSSTLPINAVPYQERRKHLLYEADMLVDFNERSIFFPIELNLVFLEQVLTIGID